MTILLGLLFGIRLDLLRGDTQQNVPPLQNQSIAKDQTVWTELIGRIGPHGGVTTVDEARQMASSGLTLTLLSTTAPDVLNTFRANGARYVDPYLSGLIVRTCQQQYGAEKAAHQPLACAIAPGQEAAILTDTATYLSRVQSDPGLAAFWILDDYPHGDVTSTLEKIHTLVWRSNMASGVVRPTICGVGGPLDVKRTRTDRTFMPNHRYTNDALSNVSPAGCDVVSPYFYGMAPTDDARLVDWSMHDLMPYFRAALERKGYNLSAPIILPAAHAFSYHADGNETYYVRPRAADITTQMKAYCEAGAFSILFFTWKSSDADRSYSNDESVREGIEGGRTGCLSIWHR